jgi:hypothetical protein
VTKVTALGDGMCFRIPQQGETVMANTGSYDDWFGQVPIDERNERSLIIAVFAILVAWLGVFVVTLA